MFLIEEYLKCSNGYPVKFLTVHKPSPRTAVLCCRLYRRTLSHCYSGADRTAVSVENPVRRRNQRYKRDKIKEGNVRLQK